MSLKFHEFSHKDWAVEEVFPTSSNYLPSFRLPKVNKSQLKQTLQYLGLIYFHQLPLEFKGFHSTKCLPFEFSTSNPVQVIVVTH